MFGFLKDKLKKAIGAFSKSAESEVHEEKVDDQNAIARAKEEEKKRVAKPKTAKPEQKQATPSAKPAKVEKTIEKKKETPILQEKEPVKEAPVQKQPAQQERKTPERTEQKEEKKEKKQEVKEKKQETDPVQKPAPAPEHKEAPKKGFFSKIFSKKEEPQAEAIEPAMAASVEATEVIEEVEEELREDEAITEHAIEVANEPEKEELEAQAPSGFFGKLKEAFTKKTLTDEKFDELFWELELAMLENNVAVEVIEKIKADLRDELTSGKISRMGIEDMITTRLRASIEELFDVKSFDFVERIKRGARPYKICIIGVNGSGKTTTLAKIVRLLQKNNLTVCVAASDTFRAAAIDQLKEHCDKLGVKLISQGYGADPAAVAFDAIKHAESKSIDVVLIDTAGRLHSNTNLMAELEKVVRVAKPDLKIFVGESITGNDCVEQAQVFNKLVGIDAIILSKADIDEKGGAAISVSYVTGKPILYLGTGQTYDDLEPFDKDKIIENVGL